MSITNQYIILWFMKTENDMSKRTMPVLIYCCVSEN